ncbi:MAG: chemotaxis protein CheW [Paracoccaceae bacterium]
MSLSTQKSAAAEPNFVAFCAADQDFCVDIMAVREIRGWTPVTSLPQSPPYIRGVINLRGSVVPIVDFRLRVGLESGEPTSSNVIIIVQIAASTIGLLVDEVSEILSMDRAAIKPTPDAVYREGQSFVSGVISLDQRMIRLIDLERFVPGKVNADPEMAES